MKRSIWTLAALAILACGRSELLSPGTTLPVGTWGGTNAGIVLGDQGAHVHMGCTYGDFPVPIPVAPNGEFDVGGSYLLRAYPVAVGPTMPARFKGRLTGTTVRMTVEVTDTVTDSTVVLGPSTVVFGQEPQMGVCPICRVPAAWMTELGGQPFARGSASVNVLPFPGALSTPRWPPIARARSRLMASPSPVPS